ncbi:hypothetical protein [Micromonospora radicis]|uniref:hypothetical protein n=1 Tax=Micromonospora radicis TaxID=1894971 RepID=UPI0018F7B0A3|nr:hypothetical protein [Micromonospora radicis]
MIDWLTGAAFTVFGVGVTWAELLGFGTGVLNVWLVPGSGSRTGPSASPTYLLFWTAGLDLIFLGRCVLGLRAWRADLRRRAGATPVPSGPLVATP